MAVDRDVLPDALKPTHYDLSLYDLELGGTFGYHGTVKIELECRKATREIVLNAIDLRLKDAEVVTSQAKMSQSLKASNISYDEQKQRVTLHFDQDLPSSNQVTLVINFTGIMNDKMSGFYRSKYKPAVEPAKSVPIVNDHHYMFSTQFESSDARRAFPCFDEPNLKASFDFAIEIPEDQVALSNMTEKATTKGSKAGLKVVHFERAPRMSTYLLAWAFGDFEYVEDFTERKYNGKHLPVRVYTTRGLKEQGRFALKNAHQIIDLFSTVFDIDYPLPKADLLAVHEFTHGAMENWGLVTYRTTAVLFDEEQSDQAFKRRVAYVVAHELAHQWFGNLVTMDWWDELWLNEGFATWVGWYAIDKLYPDWGTWPSFLNEAMEPAFLLDSLRSSHPIQVPVRNGLEVDQIFDAISYLKGSSVIRMCATHLGVETFLKGVSRYLKANQYGNGTTDALWSALSQESGQDVKGFMDVWIRKIGFPVVTIAEEPGQIQVRQSRFLRSGDVKPEEDETIWWVPLGLKTGSKPVESRALTQREETLRDIDEHFYKINTGNSGVYRTNYPPARLTQLGKQQDKLLLEDKIGLAGDAGALAASGHGTTAAVLGFLEGFQNEEHALVWQQVLSVLNNIRAVFSDDEEIAKALKRFELKLITPAVEKIGWEFPKGESFLTGQLRSQMILAATSCGHEGVIKEALHRFSQYESGQKDAIPPSLRRPVFDAVVREGGEEGYHKIRKEFEATTSIDGKPICLMSMTRVQTPELAQQYLDYSFSGAVPIQDVHTTAAGLAGNQKTRLTLWKWIQANWETVHSQLSTNMVVMDRYIRTALRQHTSTQIATEIEKFFAPKDVRGYDRALANAQDLIASNSAYAQRDAPALREWLSAHGYLTA